MKAVVFKAPGQLAVEDVAMPTAGDKDVLIKVEYCSICGTDLHSFKDGSYVKPGQIMGHEFSGTIVELGKNYQGKLKVGMRVACNPTVPCRQCVMCIKGIPNVCENAFSRTLAYGLPGAFAEYIVQPGEGYTYELPPSVDMKAGAMLEPLAVAVHAVKRAKIDLDAKIVVFGAGSIGSMVAQVAKSIGDTTIIQIDISEKRLAVAREVGIHHVLDASKTSDIVGEIAKITGPGYYGPGGAEADVLFECSGTAASAQQAILAGRNGAQIILVSLPMKESSVDLATMVKKEISMISAYAYVNEFEEAVALLASGKVNLAPVITHVYPMDRITEAFQMQMDSKNSVKVLVECK